MPAPLERLEGKYEILAKMREGGMGAVYKVRHKLLDEVRVIKVMRPSIAGDEVVRARFLREAQMAVRLRHPNLAQIFDFTVDEEGFAFIVMEFVDGFDLHQMLRTLGPPSVELSVTLIRQAIDVLGYLHRKGVVHRDVSPDNLLLTRDEDGAPLVKLIDLGIARLAGGEERLTAAGSFLGKVRYSSPEHFKGEHGAEVDARSDLYSLGLVMYELLTGRFPIPGATVPELMAGHLLQPPLPFEVADPGGRLPPALRHVVQRTLAKKPTDRFASAKEMGAALDEAVGVVEIDSAEVATLFAAPAEATLRLQVARPSSTQGHLDRNFQLTRTPAPLGEPTPAADMPRGRSDGSPDRPRTPAPDRLRAFLVGAEKLIETGHFEEARLQLEAALALDQKSSEAARLRDIIERRDRLEELLGTAAAAMAEGRFEDAVLQLEEAQTLDPTRTDVAARLEEARTGATAATARRRREEELAGTLRAIEELLAGGQLEKAERDLELARRIYGHDPVLSTLPRRLEDARAEKRRREAEELVVRAKAALAQEKFAAVLELVDQARRLYPAAGDLGAVEHSANEGLRRLAEEKRRQARAREMVERVERLLAVERTGAARLELERAQDEVGVVEGAAALEQRIESMQREAEERGRRAEDLVELARARVGDGALDAAGDVLDQIRAMTAELPDLLEVVVEIESWFERRREEERRAAALREAETSIERRLTARDLDRAERELQVAERLFGRLPSFAAFRERLECARREERNRRVEELVRSALGGQASFSDVLATLEQALEIDPLNETVQRLLTETRGAHRRYQQERRTRSAATAMLEVDRLIADGDLDGALARLDAMVAEVGAFAEAARLRPHLLRLLAPGQPR